MIRATELTSRGSRSARRFVPRGRVRSRIMRKWVAGLCVMWTLAGSAAAAENPYQALKLFSEVMELVRKRYVEGIARDSLTLFGLKGLLDSLDSYTLYLEDLRYRRHLRPGPLSFAELGICIGNRADRLVLVSPLPGSIADQRGLRPGDLVLELAHQTTVGMSLREALAYLAEQESAELLIARGAMDRALRVVVPAAAARVELFSAMLPDSVGYVRPGWIIEGTGARTRAAIAGLVESGLRALILDLRASPGEELEEAATIVDALLARDVQIGYVIEREDIEPSRYRATEKAIVASLPVAVLIGPGTCCAGEMAAASLKAYDRCVLVGTGTFAKGTLQKSLTLTPSTGIVLTYARWYTPDGLCIDRELGGWDPRLEDPPPRTVVGVTPHLAVSPDTTDVLEAALRFAGVPPTDEHGESGTDILAQRGFVFLPSKQAVDSALAQPGNAGRPFFPMDERARALALVGAKGISQTGDMDPTARLRDDRVLTEALAVLSDAERYERLRTERHSDATAAVSNGNGRIESNSGTAGTQGP